MIFRAVANQKLGQQLCTISSGVYKPIKLLTDSITLPLEKHYLRDWNNMGFYGKM